MRCFMSSDERYPDYNLASQGTSESDVSVKVDKRTAQRWLRVIEAYNQVQEEMRKVYLSNTSK